MKKAIYKDRQGREFSFNSPESVDELVSAFPADYVLGMFHFGHSHRVGSVARAASEANTDAQAAIDGMSFTVGRSGGDRGTPAKVAKVDTAALLAELARRGIDVSGLSS